MLVLSVRGLSLSESDVYRRQILTFNDGPRAEIVLWTLQDVLVMS